jgi:hypothetical protein
MYFDAPWDKLLKTVTYAVVAFFILETIVIAVALFLTASQMTVLLITSLIVVCNIVVLLFSYLYAPQGFLIDETGITIERKVAPIRIEMNSIQKATRIERDRFMKSTRTFGNGGLFGYYGSFRNKELGSFKMYATHRDYGVLVSADTHYVITPDRTDEFVDVVRSYMS